ncbi:hypothetical protein ACJ41O_003086 [Fusarium nematophilum]
MDPSQRASSWLLSQQQQDLFFAALNSNEEQLSGSPANNPLALSPTSFHNSASQTEALPNSGYQESPFLDNYYEEWPNLPQSCGSVWDSDEWLHSLFSQPVSPSTQNEVRQQYGFFSDLPSPWSDTGATTSSSVQDGQPGAAMEEFFSWSQLRDDISVDTGVGVVSPGNCSSSQSPPEAKTEPRKLCDQCGKTFSNTGNLNKHKAQVSHSGSAA